MRDFREWLGKAEKYDAIISESISTGAWRASKEEVIDHWNKLSPSMPMAQLRVIPSGHKGPTYSFDGIRITGSPLWIDYVCSRLKEVLSYNDAEGKSRLEILYKQVVDSKTQQPVPQAYVFYLQAKQRGSNKSLGLIKPKFKQLPEPEGI